MTVIPALEMISPQMARAILEGNRLNRHISGQTVARLKGDILRGAWVVTHQGIAIAPDGRLLDGQHRLTAIAESETSVPMWVFRGVDPEAFKAMDRGFRRSLAVANGKRSVEVATAAMLTGLYLETRSTSIPDGLVMGILGICQDHIETMRLAGEGGPRARAAAPIYAAAVLSVIRGVPSAYVTGLLREFVACSAGLPPVAMAMLSQMTSGQVSVRKDRWDVFARGLTMFDPERRDITKLILKDRDVTLARASKALRNYLEQRGLKAG